MSEASTGVNGYIEVAVAELPRQLVAVRELPFLIGRGKENGNHLSLNDLRISRMCAAISAGADGLLIEDRGQRDGIFVNGMPTKTRSLADGDRIRLGTDDGCQLIFHLQPVDVAEETAETKLRGLLGHLADALRASTGHCPGIDARQRH
jgi:predicted component of type VI protein secretion system